MVQTGEKRAIYWIGRTEADPYWDRCAGDLAIQEFKTIYDAVAEVLTGHKGGILVINAVIMGPELKRDVKTLLGQGLFEEILVYTTAPRIAHFTPNGDARVAFMDRPGELFDRLRGSLSGPAAGAEVTKSPKPESKPVEKEAVWPTQPPCGVLEKPEKPEKDREAGRVEEVGPVETALPVPVAEPPPVVLGKEFQAAELSREELQALLGSDIQMEKGS